MEILKIPKPSQYETLLLAIITLSTLYLQSGYSSLPIIGIQAALVLKSIFINKSQTKSAKEIICALLIETEPAIFLAFWAFIIKSIAYREKIINTAQNKLIITIFSLSFIMFAYNFISEGLIINYALWLSTFFSAFAIYLHGQKLALRIKAPEIIRFFSMCIFIQLFFLIIQSIINGNITPGDWAKGTLGDAHKLGMIFLACAVFYFLKYTSSRKISSALTSLAFITLFLLCDAKAILLSLVIALPFYFFVISLMQKKNGEVFFFIKPDFQYYRHPCNLSHNCTANKLNRQIKAI